MQVKSKVTVLKHQEKFANLKDKFCAIVGGFGSGKSEADVYRAMRLLRDREYAVICLIAPTYTLLTDVNVPDFEKVFSQYNIRYHFKKSEKKIMINTEGLNGEVWFRSADNPVKIVGFDATDIIIDEYDILKPQQQKELWIKMLGRTRACKDSTHAISTTPEGFRETYEKFGRENPAGPLIKAKTTDNIFLPKDYIDTLYDQYDELLVKQYINAEFVNINGLQAYYSFDRAKNHKPNSDFKEEQTKHLAVGIGMDFNVNKMAAQCFWHFPNERRIHFFKEIVLKNNADTWKMCEAIKSIFPNRNIFIYPDATGGSRHTSAAQSDHDILKKAGFRVYVRRTANGHPENPPVRHRLNAMNGALYNTVVTIDCDECVDFVEDLEKCELDQYGDIEKSDKQRTHSGDAGSYPVAYLYPIKKREAYTTER